MKVSFEKALWIDGPRRIAKDIDRIYFGNEFCQNLIPDLKMVRKCHAFSRNKGRGFTFVVPFVTDEGINKLRDLFGFLNQQDGVEIVFNDWGVFLLLKESFPGLKPVLGRLLTKQKRDPRLLKILSGEQKVPAVLAKGSRVLRAPRRVPQELRAHYQASIVDVPIFQEFLISSGVDRVEIDNLIWRMDVDVPREMGVSVYFPYGYVSVGRKCWLISLSQEACKKQCQNYFFRLKDNSLPVPFYSKGNAVFFESQKIDLESLRHLKKLRIVYQTRLL